MVVLSAALLVDMLAEMSAASRVAVKAVAWADVSVAWKAAHLAVGTDERKVAMLAWTLAGPMAARTAAK